MRNRWTPEDNVVSTVRYQIAWCTMFRRPLLSGQIKSRLLILLHEKAKEIDCSIESCEIHPDHVALSIDSPPTHSAHYVIQQLKAFTSRRLREEFREMKTKVPSPWTRTYFCTSLGRSVQSEIEEFVSNQRTRCDSRVPAEQIALPFSLASRQAVENKANAI